MRGKSLTWPERAGLLFSGISLLVCVNVAAMPPAVAAPRPEAPLGIGCGWALVSDISATNVAFPDEGARYWLALVPNVPGTRLRIDGRYPDARYFSFNVYDPLLRPIDAIADYEIDPRITGTNPYRSQAAEPGGAYTAYVAFTAKPAARTSNTIYSGRANLGPGLPNPVTAAIYRTYVPADFNDFTGGVGLPLLTLETADGQQELVPFADCAPPLLPNIGGILPGLPLNDLIENLDFPDALSRTLGLPTPLASYPPKTRVFYGLPDTVAGILGNVLPVDVSLADMLPKSISAGGGFLSNLHNAYTTTAFDRAYGGLYLLRAKVPTFADGPRAQAMGADPQVRYWSVCQNDFFTQRFVECSIDRDTPLDGAGYFTIAVSDPADRPHNAVAGNGIAWLPWGGIYPDGILIYRHLLAASHFAQAIQNVPRGADPASVMGEYFPVGTYCSRATFESAGDAAADIFNACLKEQAASTPDGLLSPIVGAVTGGGLGQ